jgi:hypothetical protein
LSRDNAVQIIASLNVVLADIEKNCLFENDPQLLDERPYMTINTRDENGVKQPLDPETAEALCAVGEIIRRKYLDGTLGDE